MPDLFDNFFSTLYTMPLAAVAVWALIENLMILVVCLLMGEFLVKRYQKHSVTPEPEALSKEEILLAASTILLNSLVTWIGVILWRWQWIRVDMSLNPLRVLFDTLVLFLAMDLGMYVFHRLAHHSWLYPILHQTHHRYENPRPLTLFVLNPFEVLGFGALWLMLLLLYPANWLAIIIYLTMNIVFGLVGHLGVEPMPNRWIQIPFIQYISTSTFHAEHHQDKGYNFGFYTLIWDKLFGTLAPEYSQDFNNARQGQEIQKN